MLASSGKIESISRIYEEQCSNASTLKWCLTCLRLVKIYTKASGDELKNIVERSRLGSALKEFRNELDKSMDIKSPEVQKVIQEIRDILPLIMMRRTDESVLFGRPVVKLPPLKVVWQAFTTPPELQAAINKYRKSVGLSPSTCS